MSYKITINKVQDKNIIFYSIEPVVRIGFICGTQNIDLSVSNPVKDNSPKECDINDVRECINCDINLIGMICSCYINDNLNLITFQSQNYH